MLRLAMATQAETYERLQEPLAERDIAVAAIQPSERTFRLDDRLADVDLGFVFPPRLMEGGVVDARLGVPWVNDREAVLRSRNKGGAAARLTRADITVPQTVVVSNDVDRESLVDTFEAFDPPVVIKPNSTTRGTGVAKAHDLDSFLGICDYLDLVHDYRATGDRSFLVQEFIPDARDVRVMVLDGEYAGAVTRELPDAAKSAGQWKHNVHRGATAEGIDLAAELRSLAEDTAQALEIPFLGVDLLVTEERAVVSETNARPTVDEASKYEPGFYDDLAALIRKTALDP